MCGLGLLKSHIKAAGIARRVGDVGIPFPATSVAVERCPMAYFNGTFSPHNSSPSFDSVALEDAESSGPSY